MKTLKILGCVGVAWMAMGCGGKDEFTSEDSAAASELPLEEIPDGLSEAICGTYLRCIPSWAGLFGDSSQCAETFSAEFAASGYELLEDAVQEERVSYDPEKGQDCVQDVENAPCDQLDLREIGSCSDAFTGSAALGDDCTVNEECQGENICFFGDTCPGQCAPPLDAGEECVDSDQCELGLVCSDETSRCVAPAAEGEDCEVGEPPCALPYVCLGQDEDEETPGTCVSHDEAFVGEEGDSCNFIGEVALCETGLACQVEDFDEETGLVAFCRPLVERGDDCGIALPSVCPAGDYCAGINPSQGQLGGTCEAAPTAGEGCADGILTECAFGLVCVEGTCTELQNNGEGCDGDVECHSDNCDDGVCAPTSACQ